MTIRLRILALLTLLGLFCAGTTSYFKSLHVNEEVFARQQRVNALTSRLERLISSTTRSAGRYLNDFSGRAGMVEYLVNRDPAWAEKSIEGMLDIYRLDAVWVLDATGTVVYGRDRLTDSALTAPPLPAGELTPILEKRAPFGFHEFLGGGLHYIQGRPVMAAAAMNPHAAPLGWVVVAQHWGEAMLNDLADSAQGYIALTPATHANDARAEEEMEAWQPLLDHRGRAIAGLDYHVTDTLMENPAIEKIELTILIYNGVGSVLLVGVLMHFWILRPFSIVRASLAARDPAPLAPLLNQRNEFGQMARIVQSSMRDREQLQQSLDERIRLGRELHDGVIQSVYGAGMALSRVQSLMNRDLAAAQKLLDETRDGLNRIIIDLRQHIEKADPKPLDSTFGAAAAQLIQQFHGSGQVKTKLDIDEDLVARYPVLHRSQALQFVREAVSNAVRHGHPSWISVSWQRTDEGSRLVVGDDGVGFDPITIRPGGHGLGNLSERAVALGGHLEIASGPNEGTRICLTLPTPKTSP